MELKGQGALEYLLMIGAGVAISGVVIYFVFYSGSSMTCEAHKKSIRSMCSSKPQYECEKTTLTVDETLASTKQCVWDSGRCIANEDPADPDQIDWTGSDYCD